MTGIIILIAATVLCSWRAFHTKRVHILLCGMVQNALFAMYWFSMHQYTAMSMALVGVTCIILQQFVTNFGVRFTIAMGAASIAYYISHDNWMDMIPLIAFSCGRIAETFNCHHRMRMGYQLSASAWFGFALITGDVMAIASNAIILLSQTAAMVVNGTLPLPRFATVFAVKRLPQQ